MSNQEPKKSMKALQSLRMDLTYSKEGALAFLVEAELSPGMKCAAHNPR
jgi:hypothetical protein